MSWNLEATNFELYYGIVHVYMINAKFWLVLFCGNASKVELEYWRFRRFKTSFIFSDGRFLCFW